MLFQERAMSKLATRLLIIVTLVCMPCAVFALPGVHNPTAGGFKCSTCHNASASIGAGSFNNICTSCHKIGGTSPFGSTSVQVKNQFSPGDFANPYGTYTGAVPGKSYQTSHKWTGNDVVPQAGALAPTDPYNTVTGSLDIAKGMNKPGLTGSVTCARCHNVHGDSALTSVNPPFLRSINDSDQMCRDCHRDRDKPSHTYGTHAVGVSYTSAKVKLKNAGAVKEYLPLPLTNPLNTTGQTKLVNGILICSSCHGVHFTDSNSRTFDSRSSARMNNLSASRGFLLRVDARGKAANDTNICTNCHAAKQAHNGSNQNIQCNDCHSGHVEYDGNAVTADEKMPNQFLVRRYMNISTVKGAVRNVRVFFRASSATTHDRYTLGASGDPKTQPNKGYGVCQACHFETSKYAAEHYVGGTSAGGIKADHLVCNSCHAHTDLSPSGGNSFTGGCNTCHGFPPKANLARGGANNGYAVYSTNIAPTLRPYNSSSNPKNEATTPHPTHAGGTLYSYGCNDCHNGNTHKDGVFQQVFVTKAGVIAGAFATYNAAGSGTCTAVYCHSNGVAAAPKYKSVTWGGGLGSIVNSSGRCVACHNGVIPGFNNMSTGSHFKHVSQITTTGKGYTCNYCHSGTVSSNTTIANIANHANGTANVALTGTFGALTVNGTWSGGTCSTSYCHSNGAGVFATPTWTTRTSGQCDTCHKTANNVAGILSSGKHFTHISSSYGPKLNTNAKCNSCHVYTGELGATHVDGAISKNAAGAGATWCQNCHAGAEPTGTTAWTGSTGIDCQSCHSGRGNGSADNPANTSWSNFDGTGVRAPFKGYTTFINRGHGKGATYNTCQSCHNANSAHISGVLGDSNRLLSQLGTGNSNLECTYCHYDGAKVTNAAYRNMSSHLGIGSSYTGGGGNNYSTRSMCDVCHDPHGSSNAAMVRRFISFGTAAGFGNLTGTVTFNTKTGRADYVQTSAPYRGLCQICHTKTTTFKRNSAVVAHNGSSDCLGCHGHSGKSYAFQPAGGCNGCHGYPPTKVGFIGSTNNYADYKTEDYTGGGGAHTVPGHIPATAVATQAWANCNTCHPNTGAHNTGGTPPKIQFVNVTTQDSFRFNASKAPSYTGDHSTTVGSCNNVSCHFKQTPVWNRP